MADSFSTATNTSSSYYSAPLQCNFLNCHPTSLVQTMQSVGLVCETSDCTYTHDLKRTVSFTIRQRLALTKLLLTDGMHAIWLVQTAGMQSSR